jgi:hypothetical protein
MADALVIDCDGHILEPPDLSSSRTGAARSPPARITCSCSA